MRRHSIGFWLVAIALVATFLAEPQSSLEVAGDAFTALGEFGGALVTELAAEGERA